MNRPRADGPARRSSPLALLLALAATAMFAGAPIADAAERSRGKSRSPSASKPAARKRPASKRAPAPSPPAASTTPSPAPTDTPAPAGGTAATTEAGAAPKNPGKPRVYTFGGLDLEGKLRTPQLLYFRSRMRQELDTSSPARRSFMKELEATADAQGL